MSHDTRANKALRSQEWFDNPNNPGMTALYVERYQNQAFTREELQSGKPIIGIAQTGSDLAPCNKIHVFLADRVKAGIRDAGGIPLEFPVHPIQETGKRPTAALDRNLAYLSLVEVLQGYPLDAVVLTTGCDKTTPAMLMGAATVDIPAIVLNGGPMLDGWWKGKRAGSGMIVWESRSAARLGRDRLCGVPGAGLRLGALARPLQHHGHGLDHERAGRSAGHDRCRAPPRSRRRTGRGWRWPSDGQAHRRDGAREPETLR